MADEQPVSAPVADESNTDAQNPSAEPTNDALTADQPAGTSEPPTTDNGEAQITADDVKIAGEQATTDINAPDGEGKAEADPEGAANSATPASGKGKRKSNAGVPEHKTKKLNKKKSSAQLNLNITPGDYIWARLKGFPPWPAVACDEAMLPESLLATRPVSTKRPDGSYREDFEEGGKNQRDRTYPVMFMATNEFAWMINTSLTKLEPSECEGKEDDKKMSKDLKAAYGIASESHDLDWFKELLQAHEEETRQYEAELARKDAEKAEKEAKKAEKATDKEPKEKKKSRKSKDAMAGDEMDVDDDETEAKPSKKRKKEADSEGEGPKPKKTPKVKLGTPKTNGESKKKATKPKRTVAKPEDESEEKEAEAPMSDAEKLARREKAVLYLRHRLQKGFLSRDTPPKAEEMEVMADFFSQLESYEDLEPQIIRTTKIHKVLRAVVKLPSIPREEDFNFKKRSSDLLNSWSSALSTDDAPANAINGEGKSEDTPTKTEEITKEPSAAPVEATLPGNGATDEADVTMADANDDKPAEKAAENVTEAKEESKAEEAAVTSEA